MRGGGRRWMGEGSASASAVGSGRREGRGREGKGEWRIGFMWMTIERMKGEVLES